MTMSYFASFIIISTLSTKMEARRNLASPIRTVLSLFHYILTEEPRSLTRAKGLGSLVTYIYACYGTGHDLTGHW